MTRAEFHSLLDRWGEAETKANKTRELADCLRGKINLEIAQHYPLSDPKDPTK